jgi:hypothetical protein
VKQAAAVTLLSTAVTESRVSHGVASGLTPDADGSGLFSRLPPGGALSCM